MSILTVVTLTAFRCVVGGVICKATGVPDEVAATAIGVLCDYYTDPSRKLPSIIEQSSDRAWRTLEIALAGASLWQRWAQRAEDLALAQQLSQFLDRVDVTGLPPDRAACVRELRAARVAGVLKAGVFDPQGVYAQSREFARFSDPDVLRRAEWQGLLALAQLLKPGFPNLSGVLNLRVMDEPSGLPLLVFAFRYYFGTAIAKDAELSRRITHAKLDALAALAAPSDTGLEKVSDLLDSRLGEIEQVLGGVAEGVQRVEERVEQLLRDQAEMRREQREFFKQFQMQVQDRQVSPRESSLIQQPRDVQRVREMSRRVRSLPEAERRLFPDLVMAAARLAFAAGDHDQAIAEFKNAAALAVDPQLQAEAHYNAYRAALEQHASRKQKSPEDYAIALRELVQAARLVPARYAPFDLDHYEPIRILGHGGFGVTILCREANLDREVAIKVLLQEELDRGIEDVFREGRILAKLSHANIVRLIDAKYADPARKARPYFVMEYLDGFVTLADYVEQNGPLDPRELVWIALQIATGLKAAHDKRVLHRDVKPANILIRQQDPGEDYENRIWAVKLIDFGLAVRRDPSNAATSTSTSAHASTSIGIEVAGTIDYAAPEQMNPDRLREVGPRSDVFSFGKTCIYALTQDVTFSGDEQARFHEWGEILGRCTHRNIDKRPKNFDEVLDMLRVEEAQVLPPLPEDAIESSIGSRKMPSRDEDGDGPPPPPDERAAFDWRPLKMAAASVLPGLGHVLLGQRAKGAVLLAVSLLVLLPLLSCLWPSLLVAWVLLVASDAFLTARSFTGGRMPGWTAFGVRSREMTRTKGIGIGLYCVVVVLVVQFVAGWLTRGRTEDAHSTASLATPDPRLIGEWTKPDVIDTRGGRAVPVHFLATITPASINWSGKDGNKTSRYRWVKENEIQLLDAEGAPHDGKKKTVIVRLDFISPEEVIIVIEGVMWMDHFADFHGKFRKK